MTEIGPNLSKFHKNKSDILLWPYISDNAFVTCETVDEYVGEIQTMFGGLTMHHL